MRMNQKRRPLLWILPVLLLLAALAAALIWQLAHKTPQQAKLSDRLRVPELHLEQKSPEDAVYQRDAKLILPAGSEGCALTTLDVTVLGLKADDAGGAMAALEQMKGLLGDDDPREHLRLADVTETCGSVYYRYDCFYDGLPVWGESVVLAVTADGTVELLSAAFTPGAQVSDTDLLTRELAEAGAETWAKAWLEYLPDGSAPAVSGLTAGDPREEDRLYYPAGQGRLILAYRIPVRFTAGGQAFSIELILSAADGEALEMVSSGSDLSQYAVGGSGDGNKTSAAAYDARTGLYYLRDEERDIEILNGNRGGGLKSHTTSFSFVTSADPDFGNTEEEREQGYPDALRLMDLLQKLRDFYRLRLGENLRDTHLYGIYNDGYNYGGNMSAAGVSFEGTGLDREDGQGVYIGYGYSLEHMECVGHEFGHLIQKAHVGISSSGEAGGISEGTADILWILFKWAITGEDPDWVIRSDSLGVLTERDLKQQAGLHTVISGFDIHGISTYYSHSAYLMWKGGGTGTSAIRDVDTLLELWYRTILLLNGNPSFTDGRAACEAAVGQMLRKGTLTQKQYNVVLWAFDQCGIGYVSANLDAGAIRPGELKVDVRSADGGRAVSFTLIVSRADGTEIQKRRTESASVLTVKLDAGCYVLTVRDDRGIYADARAHVTVMPGLFSSSATLEIPTTFGTNLQGVIRDEDEAPLEGVRVRAYSRSFRDADGLEKLEGECRTESDGFFFLNLRPGSYRLVFEKEGRAVYREEIYSVQPGTNTAYGITLEPARETLDYAPVIRAREAEYGHFRTVDLGWSTLAAGVNYLKLIDLDGDGSRELLLGYYDEEMGYYYDTALEVWTMRNGEPVLLGSPGVLIEGVDGVVIFLADWKGRPALVSGQMHEGVCRIFTYDGSTLTYEEQPYATWYELYESGLVLETTVLNDGGYVESSTYHDTREESMRKLFDAVQAVKAELGMETEEFAGLS